MMRRTLTGLVGLVGCWSADALACGGFFCQAVPVDQAAERIVFAVDEVERKVEVHVQISYEGAAEEFAWVVPVAANPELFASVDDLFSRLSPLTMPTWNLAFETEGTCKSSGGRGFGRNEVFMADSDDAAPMEDGSSVTVAQQTSVGPYDVVVLQATDSAELITWLQEHDYALPAELAPKLEPYVAGGSYFVALRLQKGNDAGDLVPLGMRYTGVEASIPLQLTAVAATPDMRLQPFVFARHRAVPVNYLHVQVNELAVDWLSGGANYPDVITAAADEAGGQAFATDFSGPTAPMRGTMWTPGMYRPDEMRRLTNASEVLNAMQFEAQIPVSQGTAPIISRFLEMPAGLAADGVTELQFFSCVDCWVDGRSLALDGSALADALEAEWIPAMENAEHLFTDFAVLTRLTSSISAEEMTIDPIFAFNPDLPEVSNQHQATLVTMCSGSHTFEQAPRRLVLADGRELMFPASYANFGSDFSFDDWLGDVGAYKAEVVEQLGRTGAPLVMNDHRSTINEALEVHNTSFWAGQGCGCSTGGAGGAWALLGALALVRRRRES
jgi:MYXO-CTERM domain-containing protein